MEALYDRDFYEWTQKNAQLLREGRLSEIDLENLIEELESMGRSEKRAFVNRLAVLIAHLLKWQYQPDLRAKSWRSTIKEQRMQVADLLEDNPSFKPFLNDMFLKAYKKAVVIAEKETGLEEETFPVPCPYELEEIMDTTFFPGGNA